MASPSFDLVDIIRTIQKRRNFVIIITAAAIALGAVFFLVKKKKYKAEARFLVNNPLYGDRSTLFRSIETRYVDYFGGDDDLDKVTALANSDTVRDRIIRNCQFELIYNHGSINDSLGHAFYMSTFDKFFNLKRSEYKDLQVTYTAYDPKTAAGVANMSVQVLEECYRHYYTSMKHDMYASLNNKMTQLDSAINVLTDSLANLRDRYNIYSIISPARQNVISGDIKGGGKGFGKAMEQIQNIEAVKDQLVTDKAHYVSLLNEFSTSASDSMTFLKVITRALPPTSPAGQGILVIMVVCGFLGAFFSSVFVLMMEYFRRINAVVR